MIYYIAMNIGKWSSLSVDGVFKNFRVTNDFKSVGYLEAYESLEDAKKDHPGCQIVAVEATLPEPAPEDKGSK